MGPDPYTLQFLKPRNTLVFLATLSGYLGFTLQNPRLLMLFAASLAALVMALWQTRGLLSSVRVRRTHYPRAFQGSTVAVNLEVTGEDKKEPELLVVEDSFPPATTSRIRRLLEKPLRENQVMAIQFFGPCEHRRGLYVLGPVRAEACDAMGFFRRQLIIDEFTTLTVYPEAVNLTQVDLLGEGTLAHVGLDMTRNTGASEEFLGIREYRPGDSPRIVDWKSTARHNELMVKEFEEERTTFISFFLDLGRLGLVGVGDQTSVEYGIKSCASLAKRAVERGHHIELFTVGEEVDHIPLGGGTAHLLTILDRLAIVRPGGESAFAAVVGDLAPGLARGGTAVLLMGATTIDFETIEPVIAQMIYRQILPVIVLIDDRAFIKIFREQEDRHYTALPLEEIVRNLTLMGARVHVVSRGRSMEQALLQGLERETVL